MSLGIGYVIIFAALLRSRDQTQSPRAFAWALAGFTFNPLFLIKASSPTEWSQAMFFLVCAFLLIFQWVTTMSSPALAVHCAALVVLVLSRQDFAITPLCLFVAVLFQI